MNQNLNKYISRLPALILALMVMGGCVSEKEMPAVTPTPAETEVALSISIRSADNPMSRADYDLEKTPEECKITSVSAFIVPFNAGVEDWDNAQYRMIFNPEISNEYYHLSFTIKSPSGMKHIYAAANMSHAQTLAFMDDKGEYRSTAATYKTVVDEFADTSAGGKGIVMIAQLTAAGSSGIDLSGTGARTIQTDDVELVRVVSKVLMICETDNAIAGAVAGVDYGKTINSSAWVRLSDAYFALNPTGSVLFRDPDKALDQFVTIAVPPAFPPATTEWLNTLKYESHRIGQANAAGDDHYTEGLYCLANKVSVAGTGTSTQLTVCVKYLPNTLITGYNTGRVYTPYANESDVWAALAAPAGQTDENGDPTTYPDGTCWKFNDEFYSYAGMMATINNAPVTEGVKREDFLPHLAGIGYYVVDIDPEKDVLRNYYYILTVTLFGIPKHTLEIPDGGEMLINSEKTQWFPKGVQSVIVKPE